VKDPYEVLGVERVATQDEIRRVYRRLAKKLHPDINPGDKAGEARFKEISAAYDLLSDEDKRRRFDAGEIDATGVERPRERRFYKDFAGAGGAAAYDNRSGFADFAEADDLFADLLRRQRRARGADLRFTLAIEFLEAVNGTTKRIAMPGGAPLDVTIPPGIEHGETLWFGGKGGAPAGEGDPGDVLIRIAVKPHKFFVREGEDIHLELPITLKEAVLGAKVRVPTPTGTVLLTVPKWTNTGAMLRLKSKGVPRSGGRGDQLVKLKVVLPDPPDAQLEAFLAAWTPAIEDDPRRGMQE
jgi:DnaJ-class molecular chaperone